MSGIQENQMSEFAPNAIVPIGIVSVKPCSKCGATDRYLSGGCRPCARVRSAKWSAENPERKRYLIARWQKANPEKGKTANAKCYAAHPEPAKERTVQWNAANPERKKELSAQWNTTNAETRRTICHKYRARKRAAGGSFTTEEIHCMLESQKRKCAVCRKDISKSYHIDHIMPLALGGHNGITNIQLLCPHCNLSKHDKHPVDFMQRMGFLL